MRPLPPDRAVPRRRCLELMAGAAAVTLCGRSAQAMAQDVLPPPPEPAPVPLYMNLFTRLATVVEVRRNRRSLFVLDTGAETTALSDRLATELGLARGPDLLVHGVTASTVMPGGYLPRLRVQNEVFENVLVPILPIEELGAEGLLGLNHLQAFNLLLDIRNRRAMLNPNQSHGVAVTMGGSELATRIQRRMTPVPSHRHEGLVLLDIMIGRTPVTAFLDTGSQYSVGNERLLSTLGFPSRQLQNVSVIGVSGPPMIARSGPAPDILLGTKRLPQMPLLFSDLHIFDVLNLTDRPALMIGADLLSRFDQVRINYRTNRITLGEIMRRRR